MPYFRPAVKYTCITPGIFPFVKYIVCHFGATYMDGMTGDPPVLVYMCKEDTTVEIHISIIGVKFANLVTSDPPFYFGFSKVI